MTTALASGWCRAVAAAAAPRLAGAVPRPLMPPLVAGCAAGRWAPADRQSRGFLSVLWPRPLAVRPLAAVLAPVPAATGSSPLSGPLAVSRRGLTRNIRGRLFYKRRPKWIPIYKFNRKSKWLEGVGFRKGVCTKVFVMAPRKPNSGLRKVAYVRLSNGRICKAAITGIGHNLQVHSVVMIRGGHRKDTDGCNYTCMRGKYDLLPVKGRLSRRSKYAVTRPPLKSNRERFKFIQTDVDRRLYFYKTGEPLTHEQPVPQRISKHVATRNPNATYRHNWKKTKRK